jgi:hypothetical protein
MERDARALHAQLGSVLGQIDGVLLFQENQPPATPECNEELNSGGRERRRLVITRSSGDVPCTDELLGSKPPQRLPVP